MKIKLKSYAVKTMTATFTIQATWIEAAWLEIDARGIQDVISVREVGS